jgi:dimethylaniline monooxygenase (N-oxide forming)
MLYDVIIVGGGFSGIYTLKHCIEEGLNAILLEKSTEIGGVWNIQNKPGGVQDFTYSVTSKLYLSASDYPPPEDWPEFPHASLVHEYLINYTRHFNLEPYIMTGMQVKNIQHVDDIWTFDVNDGILWKSKNIVIATGVNTCPVYPNDTVFQNFKGPSIHAHYYNPSTLEMCKNKRVLLIGGSDTACDIAMQVCEVAQKTYVSIRNGQWFQDRHLGAESPADMLYSRSVDWFIKNLLGKHYVHKKFGDDDVQRWWGKGGSDIDIWKPKCDYLNSYYNKSRDIIRMVAKGRIKPLGRVKGIEGHRIECDGMEQPVPIDIIIYATGYNYLNCTPFLEEYMKAERYKRIFPIIHKNNDYRNDNIALVGYIRPYLTSIPMLIELQSRYVAHVFSKKSILPNGKDMYASAIKDKHKQQKEFPCQAERIPFLVDPYDYSNDLASLISAHPRYLQIWLQDPFLGYCLMVDSWNHHAYRIHDEHPEKRAHAIKTIKEYHSHKTCQKIRKVFYNYAYSIGFNLILLSMIGYIVYRIYINYRS